MSYKINVDNYENKWQSVECHKAQKTIRKAWGKYQLKKEKIGISTSLFPEMNKIRKVLDTIGILEAPDLDKRIDHCLIRCQRMGTRDGLRKLAYALFSGNRMDFITRSDKNIKELQITLSDPKSLIADIVTIFRKAIITQKKDTWIAKEEMWKEARVKHEKEITKYKNKIAEGKIKNKDPEYLEFFETALLTLETKQKNEQWGNNRVNPDNLVFISHGGGFHHIVSFLTGNSEGYEAKEYEGKGIFVSPIVIDGKRIIPNEGNLDRYYATRAAGFHFFDIAAIFSATIEAKYLVKVPNIYEAALPTENVKYLKKISITILS